MNSILDPEAPEFHPHLNATVQDGYLQTNKAIRTSNTFPIGTSYDLFQTFTDFNVVTCKIKENVVVQSNQIMVKELSTARLKCNGDDDTNTEKIIDANDSLLDRININIDTLSGVNVPSNEFLQGVKTAAWNRNPVVATIKINGNSASLIGSKNIPRPQLSFKDPVDNSESLFIPRISDKPNNIKPLALSILYNDEGLPVGYEHPYSTELELYTPPARFTCEPATPPAPPPPLEETPLTMVTSEQDLDLLVAHLDSVREIAVDLEHHSYRTYQGITCLIQISTDEGGDFIVDALALREHLQKLNNSFTNPRILKVFHGADNDVLWLQRDFGVYVVGLFDTYQAARRLRLPACSLKHLLRQYCNVDTDKRYQLADWRMRPLPAELVQYARGDTHYLLYVWRCLRRDLLREGPAALTHVYLNSTHVAAQTYNKEVVSSESHMPLYVRSKKRFNVQQMTALRVLFRWRDQQARALDESTTYLLPNHMLLALAEALPRELQGLHALCSPMPPFLKHNLLALHSMILSCREVPEEPQLYRMPGAVLGMSLAAAAQPARQPHDLAHLAGNSEEQTQTDSAYEVGAEAEGAVTWAVSEVRPDLRPFETHAPQAGDGDGDGEVEGAGDPHVHVPTHLAYLAYRVESRLNADAQMFVPPFDRYRIYRAISQADELKEMKAKEAKVAAISKGNALIKEEVLEQLQRAQAQRQTEEGAETAESAPAVEETVHEHNETFHKKKTSQRKRKIIEKHEQKEFAEPRSGEDKVSHKQPNKPGSNVKPFAYKNVNYNKFYSDNDKRHKQPKTKFKKS